MYPTEDHSWCSPEQALEVERLLSEGSFLQTALKYAGVKLSTYRDAKTRWAQGRATAWEAATLERWERALAVSEVEALRELLKGGPAWVCRAWYLERRHRERWGRSAPAAARPKPPSEMTDDEIRLERERLEKGGPA